jgi:predicted phosphodiesterase
LLKNGINVAGYSTALENRTLAEGDGQGPEAPEEENGPSEEDVLFRIAFIADSHNFNGVMANALSQAKENGVSQVFHLGDMTDWGDVTSLQNAKSVLDSSELAYYTLPGDHDLAESASLGLQGARNFTRVFGKNYRSVTVDDYKFVLLDNSANYTVVDSAQMDWFREEVKDADFVLLPQPVYISADNIFHRTRVMGIVDGELVTKVNEQAQEILGIIRESNVRAVFFADHHMSSTAKDPVNEDLAHYGVGAVVSNSEGLRSLQKSRFSILTVYNFGDFEVSEVVLE